MITDAILNLFYLVLTVLTTPLRVLPNVTADTNLISTISTFSIWAKNINDYAPVDTFLTVMVSLFTIELLVAIYKAIMWAIRRLPGQG